MYELSLERIAESINGRIYGDAKLLIRGINSLSSAQKGEISFFTGGRLRDHVKTTKASALIVKELSNLFDGPQLIVPDPYLAYAKVASIFEPPVPRYDGVSDKAVIGDNVDIGNNVSIYPFVYVGHGASIGSDVILFPGVFIGDRVKVDDGTVIYPNAAIMSDCIIGKRVIIHGGAIIGSDGFGFAKEGDRNVKIPQTGVVQIEDEVEIGANTTIDRAALGKTIIRKGVKADNLVQIGHNVVVGEHTVIVAQVGIAGSTKIGNNVVIGGQVGFTEHLVIGDRVMIGGKSGITHSLQAGEIVSGIPAMPHRLWLKTRGYIKKLPLYSERLKELERKVKELEKQLNRE